MSMPYTSFYTEYELLMYFVHNVALALTKPPCCTYTFPHACFATYKKLHFWSECETFLSIPNNRGIPLMDHVRGQIIQQAQQAIYGPQRKWGRGFYQNQTKSKKFSFRPNLTGLMTRPMKDLNWSCALLKIFLGFDLQS